MADFNDHFSADAAQYATFRPTYLAAYQVERSNGQFKVVGKPYGTAPYGIAIPKGNGMAKPVLAGLEALMADGRYQAILKKWGVQQGAISTPKINGAIS